MLEPPDLDDQLIISGLEQAYGMAIDQLTFLPLGADFNAAVYRAQAEDSSLYFVKLRRGAINEVSLTLPYFLHEQGLATIIAPLSTRSGQLSTQLQDYAVIVYPFVEGQNASIHALSEYQWADFGRTLRQLHSTGFPDSILQSLPYERYDAHWCNMLRAFMLGLDHVTPGDQIAAALIVFLKQKYAEILTMIERTEHFAELLRKQPPDLVVCHTDAHAWNLLIDTNGRLYVVDWDFPMLAPKERDLMFIGAGLGFVGCTPEQEEQLFYRGYGHAQINTGALAYYRYVRIIEDIALYYEHIVAGTAAEEDRKQSLYYVQSNFQPGGTLERAYVTDPIRMGCVK